MKPEHTTQKIGEILVIGPPGEQHSQVLNKLCPKVMKSDQNMEFGHLEIAPDLGVFLYAITYNQQHANIAWDLIARKMMGAVVLFSWEKSESFEHAKQIADFLQLKFDAPCLIAADIQNGPLPVHKKIAFPCISLSTKVKLAFFNSNSTKSIKLVLATLIDTISQYAE